MRAFHRFNKTYVGQQPACPGYCVWRSWRENSKANKSPGGFLLAGVSHTDAQPHPERSFICQSQTSSPSRSPAPLSSTVSARRPALFGERSLSVYVSSPADSSHTGGLPGRGGPLQTVSRSVWGVLRWWTKFWQLFSASELYDNLWFVVKYWNISTVSEDEVSVGEETQQHTESFKMCIKTRPLILYERSQVRKSELLLYYFEMCSVKSWPEKWLKLQSKCRETKTSIFDTQTE